MPKDLPSYITILFILTTLATLLFFFVAVSKSRYSKKNAKLILAGLSVWLVLQAVLARNGVYENTSSLPPKFILAVLPPFLLIVILFLTKEGRRFLDGLPLQTLTWLNIVRVPVETGLYWLFLHKTIPQLMTFEGCNFDIISGLTAPFIAWLGFARNKLPKTVILLWNSICLLLVLNIVTIGILSVPTPFQQLGFDQPNTAVLYFPFIWLPAFIVPMVIFTHLVSIRQLGSSLKR